MSDKISEVNKTVSKRLRDLADKAGTTQTQLAKEMGIDRGVFFKDCSGERSVTLERLQKYSKYFNVSTDYLLGLTDIQTPETDIQAVCELTGLPERFITMAINLKKHSCNWLNDNDVCTEFLRKLIDIRHDTLIRILEDYLKSVDEFIAINKK